MKCFLSNIFTQRWILGWEPWTNVLCNKWTAVHKQRLNKNYYKNRIDQIQVRDVGMV